MILITQGDLSIGSGAYVKANGGKGAGGSGGGVVLALHAGTLTNNGTVQASGGPADSPPYSSAGGNGSVLIEKIDGVDSACPTTGTFQGAFASGTADIDAAGNTVEFLKRDAAFSMKTDFVKVSVKGSYTTPFEPTNFQGVTPVTYVSPNASASLIIDPSVMLRRVVNPPGDFLLGTNNEGVGLKKADKTVAYDNHPTTPSVFHGMFELTFKLATTDFDGTLYIDYYIQKSGENYKKIGSITAPPKPTSGDWIVRAYWNSRAAGLDWTAADAQPYRTDGPVRFKFEVR